MCRTVSWGRVLLLLGIIPLTLSTAQAQAQYSPWVNPYAGGWWYGGQSYMSGVADVYRAQGQFLIDKQSAWLRREQVRQARIDTQRRIFDEAMYERSMTPTAEQVRQQRLMESLERSRNQPPMSDIISGRALNDLMDAIRKSENYGAKGAAPPLSPEVLSKINVTGGEPSGTGPLSMIRRGKIAWPVTLTANQYAPQRMQLDNVVPLLVQQAASGSPNAETLKIARDNLAEMRQKLLADINELSFNDYSGSKRFLNQLGQAVETLATPDAANYVTGKWAAKGSNASELVNNMITEGLRFAPAAAGDEAAYRIVWQSLMEYDSTLTRMLGGARSDNAALRGGPTVTPQPR